MTLTRALILVVGLSPVMGCGAPEDENKAVVGVAQEALCTGSATTICPPNYGNYVIDAHYPGVDPNIDYCEPVCYPSAPATCPYGYTRVTGPGRDTCIPDGTCNDGNACTYQDHCSGSSCVGTAYSCSLPPNAQSSTCIGNGYCQVVCASNKYMCHGQQVGVLGGACQTSEAICLCKSTSVCPF
jgi:hypothetical protein